MASVAEEYERIKDTLSPEERLRHLETMVPMIAKVKEFKDKHGV